MEQKQRKTIAKYSGIKMKDYFFYAIGDFGTCLVFGCANSLLQTYYSDCLGFNPIYILVIYLVARIWDAVNDIIMGRICDRIRPGKSGKFKRYLLWMCMPFAVASVLMFALNANSVDAIVASMGSMWPAYVLAGFTYILFGMCMTAIQIPYSSLASVVTLDASERGKLSIWRGVLGQLGGIPALAVKAYAFFPPTDPDHKPVEWEPLIIGVGILAVFTVLLLLVCYFGTKERYTAKQVKHDKGSMKRALSRIAHSRSMLSICVISAIVAGAGMFTTAYSGYVVRIYFEMSGWRQTLPDFSFIAAIFIMMIATPWMSKKFGKKETTVFGLGISTTVYIVMVFLRYAGASESVYWIYVALNFISGLGTSFFSMLMWGMVADAVDDMEVKHGVREDGTSLSLMLFFRKVGQCLSFVAVNLSLIAMGRYVVSNWSPSPDQLILCWNLGAYIPLICYAVGMLLFIFWFPINKRRLEEIQDEKEELLASIEKEKQDALKKLGLAK